MRRLVLLVVLGALLAAAVLVLHRRARAGLEAERWRLEQEDGAARQTEARALASALDQELELLLAREGKNGWDAWRPLVLPPDLVAKSVALAPSPLARTPADPLVAVYFELRDGRLVGPGEDRAALTKVEPLLAPLRGQFAAPDPGPLACQAAVDPLAAATNIDPAPTLSVLNASSPDSNAQLTAEWDAYRSRRSQRNVRDNPQGQANPQSGQNGQQQVWSGGQQLKAEPSAKGTTFVTDEEGNVPLAVYPLRWLATPAGPDGWPTAAAAVRRVELGGRAWLQGFALDLEALRTARLPAVAARVAPRPPDPADALRDERAGTLGMTFTSDGGLAARRALVPADLEVVAATQAPPDAPRLEAPLSGLAVVHRGAPLDASRVVSGGQVLLDGALVLAVGVLVAGLVVLALAARGEARLAQQRADFVAALTHELKAPLTGFRALTELLHDGLVPTEEKKREYYAAMLAESERLSRLVQNVLDASRLERGPLEVVPASLDPGPLVADVVGRFRPRLESEGFTVELSIDDDLPAVLVDREALAHVLGNLLDNAAKYGRGAEPRLRIEARAARGLPGGGGVEVAVQDRGPGIPAAERGRVFERFWRSPDVPRQVGGAGLGLTIARAQARAMGGDLVVADPAGGPGARFVLRLRPQA